MACGPARSPRWPCSAGAQPGPRSWSPCTTRRPAAGPPRLSYELLERICARRADLMLGASADLVARMQNLGAAEVAQFDVPAPRGQPPTAAEVAKARADVGAAGRPVVLAAGRLAPQKSLDVLVDAAARWQHRQPTTGHCHRRRRSAGGRAARAGRPDRCRRTAARPAAGRAGPAGYRRCRRRSQPVGGTCPDRAGGDARGPAARCHPDGRHSGADRRGCCRADPARGRGRACGRRLRRAGRPAAGRSARQAARARSATFPSESDAIDAALAIYVRLAR